MSWLVAYNLNLISNKKTFEIQAKKDFEINSPDGGQKSKYGDSD